MAPRNWQCKQVDAKQQALECCVAAHHKNPCRGNWRKVTWRCGHKNIKGKSPDVTVSPATSVGPWNLSAQLCHDTLRPEAETAARHTRTQEQNSCLHLSRQEEKLFRSSFPVGMHVADVAASQANSTRAADFHCAACLSRPHRALIAAAVRTVHRKLKSS